MLNKGQDTMKAKRGNGDRSKQNRRIKGKRRIEKK